MAKRRESIRSAANYALTVAWENQTIGGGEFGEPWQGGIGGGKEWYHDAARAVLVDLMRYQGLSCALDHFKPGRDREHVVKVIAEIIRQAIVLEIDMRADEYMDEVDENASRLDVTMHTLAALETSVKSPAEWRITPKIKAPRRPTDAATSEANQAKPQKQ